MKTGNATRDLRGLLDSIAKVEAASFDVADLEPLLVELLALLSSPATDRTAAEQILVEQVGPWPPGSVEALEFTMRTLRWPAVQQALLAHVDSDDDFRLRDQSRRVLEVFDPIWDGGGIYAYYRAAEPRLKQRRNSVMRRFRDRLKGQEAPTGRDPRR